MTQRRKRPPSTYRKKLLGFIDQYIDATGKHDIDMREVAAWAIRNGLWEPPNSDLIKQLQRDLSRAAREDYIEDENGEPVRRRHSYRVKSGEKQLTLWVNIEDATPKQMKVSAQQRRRGILADCISLKRDVNFYNNNYNPGDWIIVSMDFEQDAAENQLPSEYDDTPPDDDQGDD